MLSSSPKMIERCAPNLSIEVRTPMLPGIDENPVTLIIRERSDGPQPSISILSVSVVCQIAPADTQHEWLVLRSTLTVIWRALFVHQ